MKTATERSSQKARWNAWLPVLGLVAGTFPFIWFRLDYDFRERTARTVWDAAGGLTFLRGLLPVVAVLGLVILWGWAAGRWGDKLRMPALGAKVRAPSWLLGLVALAVAAAGLGLNNKMLSLAVFAGLYMIQAVGLNIAVGMTGLLVLGYAAFVAAGGYTFALLQLHIPGIVWWQAVPAAFLVGGILGWVVGLPCLRLRGDYLAIVTLGFAESFRELMRNLTERTGGDKGIAVSGAAKLSAWPGLSLLQTTYLVVLVAVALIVVAVGRVYHSHIGRAWVAIREDEVAAAAMGVPVVTMKLLAFALSSAIGAVSGCLYVAYAGFVDPSAAAFPESVLVLAMVILGGLGSIPGALLGAALLFGIPALLRDYVPALADYRLLLFGVLMVVMMLLRPQGLLGSRRHQLELEGRG
jgi:branched-chain amino acid transport system permease protein